MKDKTFGTFNVQNGISYVVAVNVGISFVEERERLGVELWLRRWAASQ